MISPNKVLTVSLGFLTTLLVFVEAGHHGSGNELATLIAAGLITLLLKEGSAKKGLSLSGHAHGLMLPPAHGLNLESFAHPRNVGGFGFHAFNFAPMFGGLRYHLAGLEQPLLNPEFNKGMQLNAPFVRNFGHFPPLPNVFGNNKDDRSNNHFDLVHNIIQREREQVPQNAEVQNEPPFNNNPDNRDFFNFDQDGRPQSEHSKQRMN